MSGRGRVRGRGLRPGVWAAPAGFGALQAAMLFFALRWEYPVAVLCVLVFLALSPSSGPRHPPLRS